jgi:hypothetical protein
VGGLGRGLETPGFDQRGVVVAGAEQLLVALDDGVQLALLGESRSRRSQRKTDGKRRASATPSERHGSLRDAIAGGPYTGF